MTTDEELVAQFSERLHSLLADTPPGRNLVPQVQRAAARRRGRVLALGTGLGVTSLVAAGAVMASALRATSTTTTSTSRSSATAAASGPVRSADSAATLRSTPFLYERSINEQYGIRSERRAWIGRTEPGRVEQPIPARTDAISMALDGGSFKTYYGDDVAWDAFSAVPTVATLQRWMWGTPAESTKTFGSDLTGTSTGAQYAFKEGEAMLNETPTTAEFRLAVVAAMKQLPGVEVVGPASDEIGRSGIQLSLDAGGDVGVAGSTTLDIIDPADGRLLQSTLVDQSVCAPGNPIWRGVFLESGAVGDDRASLPTTTAAPTGHPASCVPPGQQAPPGSKP